MDQDERCCGSGTCIINAEGLCWCGQQWNGTAMCQPGQPAAPAAFKALEASAPTQRALQADPADRANPAQRDTP